MEAIKNISKIISKSYSLIISQGFKLLDKISCIDDSIFKIPSIKALENNIDVINSVVFCLVCGFVIFFILKSVLSIYSDTCIIDFYHYILKIIIVTIICFNSLFICRKIIYINSLFSSLIKTSLEEIGDVKLEFQFLKEDINTLDDYLKSISKSGIDRIKDSIVSLYAIYLIVVYACRYVVVIICIILSPFMIILLLDKSTAKITYMWLKIFIFSLLIEDINYFILFIPITSKSEKDLYSIILIGSLFIMYKINKKIGELI